MHPLAQPIEIYEYNPVLDTPVGDTRLAVVLREVSFLTRRLRIAEPEDIDMSRLSFRAMNHALPLKSMGPEPGNRSRRPQSQ